MYGLLDFGGQNDVLDPRTSCSGYPKHLRHGWWPLQERTTILVRYCCTYVCVWGGEAFTHSLWREGWDYYHNSPIILCLRFTLSLSWMTRVQSDLDKPHCFIVVLANWTIVLPLHPLHKRPEVSGRKVKKELNTILGRTTLSNSHTPIYININMQLKGSSAPLLWPRKGSQKINNVDNHNFPLAWERGWHYRSQMLLQLT